MPDVTFSSMTVLFWAPLMGLFLALGGTLAWLIAKQPPGPRTAESDVPHKPVAPRPVRSRAVRRRSSRPLRALEGQALALTATFVLLAAASATSHAADSPLLAYWNDPSPARLMFAERAGVAPGAVVESEEIVVRGIGVPVLIRIENGEYRVDDGAYTQAPGLVEPGQSVRVRHRAAPASGALTRTRVRVGARRATFVSRTH